MVGAMNKSMVAMSGVLADTLASMAGRDEYPQRTSLRLAEFPDPREITGNFAETRPPLTPEPIEQPAFLDGFPANGTRNFLSVTAKNAR
jgi:hypothetical protein